MTLARSLAVTLVAVMPLAACTAVPPRPHPAPSRTAPASVDTQLLGTWTLTDAVTGETGTLTFSTPRAFTAELACGVTSGSWVTADSTWLAIAERSDPDCVHDNRSILTWIDSVIGINPTNTGWDLTNAQGTTLVSLSDASAAQTNADGAYTARPLPPDLTASSIEGEWVTSEIGGKTLRRAVTVVFRDGSWVASTRMSGLCAGGRYAELGDGFVLAITLGFGASLGCEADEVNGLVSQMRTAGFDGDELVLFDASGDELVRFARG
ncbi:hypothetical protein M2152_001697 [Microbacteriaceae bacterium SG_E_30_P1]|uniref:META domain-containing protein n=1 Tax=Antiquaquibacter oligotrophicus TaxID=2880260 RepID=A0ABT6KND2_9MICO|nr:hypothetical protein [Antiquaquibacter oligotrophicus]MDH6181515.1 hypothetical protein [Antiquaquibacter oligotrophicus]UDF12795.1 hypothetical protein LH407_11615 [Antiquaquibacter oligotrophicus]